MVQHTTPGPIIFAPASGQPRLLFVLLHGGSANPEQLEPLTRAIKLSFPQALVVLPYGAVSGQEGVYDWYEQANLNEANYVQRVHGALPALIAYIQKIQAKYGLTGEHTALAGFDQGATIALEASLAQPNLAGRVLAFSGSYARLPGMAPPATTLHLLHGADDALIPVADIRSIHSHIADLQGDATLDIASRIGHEMHEALVRQAITRLQTCVPLRSWQEALDSLKKETGDAGGGEEAGVGGKPGPTLH